MNDTRHPRSFEGDLLNVSYVHQVTIRLAWLTNRRAVNFPSVKRLYRMDLCFDQLPDGFRWFYFGHVIKSTSDRA